MKETRTRFTPPPTPEEDLKAVVQYIRRLNVLLPGFLDQMQKMIGEIRVEAYDVGVAVPAGENLIELEAQASQTASAGIV